jgi:hypothetical protein
MQINSSHPQLVSALVLVAFAIGISGSASAQMQRVRSANDVPPEEIFWAPSIINTASVTNLDRRNLNFTIMHVFGIATNGAADLFGLDGAANIRFGLDYGITNWLSVGIGRSRYDKLVDGRFKASLVKQRHGSSPLAVAVRGSAGIATVSNELDAVGKMNYLGSLMVASKVGRRLSLQLTPMFSHFNTVFRSRNADDTIRNERNDHIAVSIGGRMLLTQQVALTVEYTPVIGNRSDGTSNAFAVGVDLETGGHVFQLFVTSSQWLTEQHMIARNSDNAFAGDVRLGFNVNRVFAL